MKKTKAQIIARMNELGVSKRVCLGERSIERAVDITLIDKESRLIPFVLVSANNAGERYDWWEDETYIEELDPAGATFARLSTFFTDHVKKVDNAIGRIGNVVIENGAIKGDVTFGSDTRASDIFQKYSDGILSDVSIGYRVNDVTITKRKDEPDHIMVTDFEIMEVSAVWRGFDAGATIGREVEDTIPKVPKMDTRVIDTLRKKLNLEEN